MRSKRRSLAMNGVRVRTKRMERKCKKQKDPVFQMHAKVPASWMQGNTPAIQTNLITLSEHRFFQHLQQHKNHFQSGESQITIIITILVSMKITIITIIIKCYLTLLRFPQFIVLTLKSINLLSDILASSLEKFHYHFITIITTILAINLIKLEVDQCNNNRKTLNIITNSNHKGIVIA